MGANELGEGLGRAAGDRLDDVGDDTEQAVPMVLGGGREVGRQRLGKPDLFDSSVRHCSIGRSWYATGLPNSAVRTWAISASVKFSGPVMT